MESALTTTPPMRCARAAASADLPLAVGPAIRMACRMGRPSVPVAESSAMSLVATLVCHPSARILTPLVAHKALAAVDASNIDWLAPDVACDLRLPAGVD